MTAVTEAMDSLRERAQEEIGRSLAEELPEEDAEARAWALLVDLVEEENRRRVLGRDEPMSPEERTATAQELFSRSWALCRRVGNGARIVPAILRDAFVPQPVFPRLEPAGGSCSL